MLTLAINTASQESALALIEHASQSTPQEAINARILGESTWTSNANESEKVLPGLLALLQNAGKTWQDVTHVFVVAGPGAYTSLRVGITIANALAWVLKVPVLTTDVFTIWEHRLSSAQRDKPYEIAIAAGKNKVLLKGEDTPQPLFNLASPIIYGELPDDFPGRKKVVQSFGEALVELNLTTLSSQKQVEPLYIRPPDITQPRTQKS